MVSGGIDRHRTPENPGPTEHKLRTGKFRPVCTRTATWLCADHQACGPCADDTCIFTCVQTPCHPPYRLSSSGTPFEKVTLWQVDLRCPNWQSLQDSTASAEACFLVKRGFRG